MMEPATTGGWRARPAGACRAALPGDWKRLSLSARATQRRDKDVHRRLRALAQAERDQELGPPFPWPREDGLHDGPEWPETQVHLLLARGGRYRVSHDDRDPARVCDGEYDWLIRDGTALRIRVPGPPFRGVLLPRWLLACYDVTITATTEAARRPSTW